MENSIHCLYNNNDDITISKFIGRRFSAYSHNYNSDIISSMPPKSNLCVVLFAMKQHGVCCIMLVSCEHFMIIEVRN